VSVAQNTGDALQTEEEGRVGRQVAKQERVRHSKRLRLPAPVDANAAQRR
jgi:hypothetical protein